MLARSMFAGLFALTTGIAASAAAQKAAPAQPAASAAVPVQPAAPAATAPAATAPAGSTAAPAAAAPAPAASAFTALTPPGDPAVANETDGKFFDADGNPTFKIAADGTVDWYTYSGYRRYHSECHVCHGPDGLGSSYAPKLVDSLKRFDYNHFLEVVASGKQDLGAGANRVMPAFGTNLNVMCYVDDIYVYLRARAQGNLPRNRPPKRADKSATAKTDEQACIGS